MPRPKAMDLFSDEPPLSIDLIVCRNVFIYFTREQQERVIATLRDTVTTPVP